MLIRSWASTLFLIIFTAVGLSGCGLISDFLTERFSPYHKVVSKNFQEWRNSIAIDPLRVSSSKINLSPDRGAGIFEVSSPAPAIQVLNGKKFFSMEGKSDFKIHNLSLKDLNANEQFTLFIVFIPKSISVVNDLWSWGDCANQRFLIHAPQASGSAHAMFGNPNYNALDIELQNKTQRPFILALRRTLDTTTFIVNEDERVMQGSWNKISLDSSTLSVGSGACGHYFQGLLGDVWYAPEGLSDENFRSVYKFFDTKYRQ